MLCMRIFSSYDGNMMFIFLSQLLFVVPSVTGGPPRVRPRHSGWSLYKGVSFMKYKRLDSFNYKGYKIHIFEIRDKKYLLIRIYILDECIHQFFSNSGHWTRRFDEWIKKGA